MADFEAAPTAPREPTAVATRKRRRGWLLFLLALLVIPALLVVGYVQLALRWAYAEGERAGYVQKFSRKGWICKTWEGELAMVTIPGTMPQIFAFTVRADAVAARVNETMGQRVSLRYEQHRGLPTTCFGETEYFVTAVRPLPSP